MPSSARKTLNEWPGARFAYRAVEVREILGLLDQVIADLRAKVGQTGTSFALVAPPPVLPDEPLLPEPSEAEMVEQLMTAAQLAQTPAERTSLLQTLLGLLDRAVGILPKAWAGYVRGEADREARGGTEAGSRVCRAADHDADVRGEERRPCAMSGRSNGSAARCARPTRGWAAAVPPTSPA